MRKLADLSKLELDEQYDDYLKQMVKECNALIDRYNEMDDSESEEAKELKVTILNYKNKIAKIKEGY